MGDSPDSTTFSCRTCVPLFNRHDLEYDHASFHCAHCKIEHCGHCVDGWPCARGGSMICDRHMRFCEQCYDRYCPSHVESGLKTCNATGCSFSMCPKCVNLCMFDCGAAACDVHCMEGGNQYMGVDKFMCSSCKENGRSRAPNSALDC